jgi:hypothetical protein
MELHFLHYDINKMEIIRYYPFEINADLKYNLYEFCFNFGKTTNNVNDDNYLEVSLHKSKGFRVYIFRKNIC